MSQNSQAVVVGGGLSGLSAACRLAREGVTVSLYERADELGGRARSVRKNGFALNFGPHAIYRGGPFERTLHSLQVDYTSHPPPRSARFATADDASELGASDSLKLARFFTWVACVNTHKWDGIPIGEWLSAHIPDSRTRELVRALVRVSSYVADDAQSAGAALRQLNNTVMRHVEYIDGGWQSVIEGLTLRAEALGVSIHRQSAVTRVESDRGLVSIRLDDETALHTDVVILATGPKTAAQLLPQSLYLPDCASRCVPARAACLDVALARMRAPKARATLGLDDAFYMSAHSSTARVAPVGDVVIHVAKYLRHGESCAREELETWLSRFEPEWRTHLVHAQYLPAMVVTNAVVRADEHAYEGRATCVVKDVKNVFVAGDWVGPNSMLADAACASARTATQAALQRLANSTHLAA